MPVWKVSCAYRRNRVVWWLHFVHAPTLLIVSALDDAVLEVNRAALAELPCKKRLKIVPGATHLFEEPGKLDEVAARASRWFRDHLRVAATH